MPRILVAASALLLLPALLASQVTEAVAVGPRHGILPMEVPTRSLAPARAFIRAETAERRDYRMEGAVLFGVLGAVAAGVLSPYSSADVNDGSTGALVVGGSAMVGAVLGYFAGTLVTKPEEVTDPDR